MSQNHPNDAAPAGHDRQSTLTDLLDHANSLPFDPPFYDHLRDVLVGLVDDLVHDSWRQP